jgi:hypothetical protein
MSSSISSATAQQQLSQAQLATATKTVIENAATRNGDGTFGPKHTLRPPLSAVQGTSAVAFDVKI